MRLTYFYICCFLLLGYHRLSAQQTTELYSVNYNQAKVSAIVADLETKTGFHFYYDNLVMDSVTVTATVDQKPLNVILTTIFQNTGVNYVIQQKNIFLSKMI